MTDVAAPDRSARRSSGRATDEPREVTRHASLPNGRAVVGGFLVAASAVGIFAAYRQAAAGPTTSFVVTQRDVPVGARLTPDDLVVLPMTLPDVVADRAAFRREDALIGATAVSPMRKGQLVQASDVVEKRSGPEELEVSFAIERARALAGSLQPGERVDVLATFGAGGDTYSVAVVRGAQVLEVRPDSGALAGSDTDVVRVALSNPNDALALTHAVNAGEVTLVRTTGTTATGAPGQTYRAPASQPGGEQP